MKFLSINLIHVLIFKGRTFLLIEFILIIHKYIGLLVARSSTNDNSFRILYTAQTTTSTVALRPHESLTPRSVSSGVSDRTASAAEATSADEGTANSSTALVNDWGGTLRRNTASAKQKRKYRLTNLSDLIVINIEHNKTGFLNV